MFRDGYHGILWAGLGALYLVSAPEPDAITSRLMIEKPRSHDREHRVIPLDAENTLCRP